MTLVEAQTVVRAFLGALGIESAGLSALGIGGVAVDGTTVAFQFADGALKCSAVVFQFREPAIPAVLEQLMAFDKRQKLSDARGQLVYEPESKTLAVERTFTSVLSAKELTPELLELVRRALHWSTEGIFEATKKAQ